MQGLNSRSEQTSKARTVVLVAGGFAIAVLCAVPLSAWIAHGSANGAGIVWGRAAERRLILAAFIPYAVCLYSLRRLAGVPRALIIGFAASFWALLLVLPSVASRDIYSYLFYGRMLTHAHLNPLATAPSRLAGDQWFALVGWKGTPSVYGPLWTYVSGGVAHVAWPHMWPAALALKVLSGGAAFAGCIGAARLASNDPDTQNRALMAALWNPLMIFTVAGDGHVDGLLIGLIVGALCARRAGRMNVTTMLLVAASLIKIYCGLFLFLHLVALLRDRTVRRSVVAWHAVAAAIAAGVAYAPLWAGRATFAGLTKVGGLFSGTLSALFHRQAYNFVTWLGGSDARATRVSAVATAAVSVSVLALLTLLLLRRRRRDDETPRADETPRLWAMAFAAYLLTATWFIPGHAVLLIALSVTHVRPAHARADVRAGTLTLSAISMASMPVLRFGVPVVVAIVAPRFSGPANPDE